MNKIITVGIDEAGRGPLAGPLSVATVCIKGSLNLDEMPYSYLKGSPFKDSKKLTEKRREEIYEKILKDKNIEFYHVFVSAKEIDKIGISKALRRSVESLLSNFDSKKNKFKVMLDGALSAPDEYGWESIKKGDEKFIEIALASVVAKVKRDNYMIKISDKYPAYGFEKHKGYGTKAHFDAIKKHGLSSEHRKSFLKKFFKNRQRLI